MWELADVLPGSMGLQKILQTSTTTTQSQNQTIESRRYLRLKVLMDHSNLEYIIASAIISSTGLTKLWVGRASSDEERRFVGNVVRR